MVKYRSTRLVGALILAMVAAIVTCVITRSDVPMFIWLLAFCGTLFVKIGHEWFIVNKPVPPPKTVRQVIKLILGSYPYLAGLVFVGVLAYISVKWLLQKNIGSYESGFLGKIVFFAVGSVFIGPFFLFLLTFVIGLRRRRR